MMEWAECICAMDGPVQGFATNFQQPAPVRCLPLLDCGSEGLEIQKIHLKQKNVPVRLWAREGGREGLSLLKYFSSGTFF